jgi:beta-lactamase superfamily II metal-dependent hydrolase
LLVSTTVANAAKRGRMEVVFLDVGNSSAAYVDVGGQFNLLIDAGGKAKYGSTAATQDGAAQADVPNSAAHAEPTPGSNERRASDYLAGRGVRRVDIAIASHGDIDHIEGFFRVIDDLTVSRLLIPEAGFGVDSGELRELAAYAAGRGVSVEACARGDVYELGGLARLEILSPPRGADVAGQWIAKPTGNDLSLVAALSFGSSRALFCGDIGNAAEQRLADEEKRLGAQLISVPHHGSKYSSCAAFLEAVSPAIAVAGVGRNSYGHPSPDAVGRYMEAGAEFRRTDFDGMVAVSCGKDGAMRVSCYNDWENQYIFLGRQDSFLSADMEYGQEPH